MSSNPGIYYCGTNWNSGYPAGGYCGIQDNSLSERRSIFSVWDSDTQNRAFSTLVSANESSVTNRFGGKGEGEHTHEVLSWREGTVFRFVVIKKQGPEDTTETSYYRISTDMSQMSWIATIRSPNVNQLSFVPIFESVASFFIQFHDTRISLGKIII